MNVKVYDAKAAETLFDALKTRARGNTQLVKVTRADAVALTGMPSAQAEPALKALVHSYRSHLAVTDEGELVYEFDPSFERRDKVPLAEKLRAAGQVAARGLTFAFKIWIVVTLVAYVVAFVAMMVAMTVMGRSDDRRRGGGFGFPWIWYWMMPDLAPAHDYYGRAVRRQKDPHKKRFYQSVFDFVFGPKRALQDPKEMEKRLVGFLREHKGRVTSSELAALTGLSLADADEELTRLMMEYDGEVEVAEDGTLLYVFDDLMRAAGQPVRWSWDFDRREAPEPLTANTPGTNLAVGGFAGFNLLASLTVGPAFLARAHLLGEPWAWFLALWFPLAFSFIFFLVPSVRWAEVRGGKTRRSQRRQLRRQLFREIWKGEPINPALRSVEERKLLDELLVELDGDVDTDESGRVRYRFPRIAGELAAVKQAREKAAPAQLGQVIFDSADAKLDGAKLPS